MQTVETWKYAPVSYNWSYFNAFRLFIDAESHWSYLEHGSFCGSSVAHEACLCREFYRVQFCSAIQLILFHTRVSTLLTSSLLSRPCNFWKYYFRQWIFVVKYLLTISLRILYFRLCSECGCFAENSLYSVPPPLTNNNCMDPFRSVGYEVYSPRVIDRSLNASSRRAIKKFSVWAVALSCVT